MIIPLGVEVWQERTPVMNWLLIGLTIACFGLQVYQMVHEPVTADGTELTGISRLLILDGWALRGLFGHILLHGGLFHLLGNMLFLWVFGNAVCARVGNTRYIFIYLLLGLSSGIAHNLFSDGMAWGASGAINGVVGMFLVFYPRNDINCFYWILIFFGRFSLSSYWMILWWLFWDLLGFFFCRSVSDIAYAAHVGGFVTGFGIAYLMCLKGWVDSDRWDESLYILWQKRPKAGKDRAGNSTLGGLDEILQSTPISPALDPSSQPLRIEIPDEDEAFPDQVTLACPCGATFVVSQTDAGQETHCQACTICLEIPPAPLRDGMVARRLSIALPQTMAETFIRFACTCGKRIKVPTRHAGRSGKCPGCGQRLRIPSPPA